MDPGTVSLLAERKRQMRARMRALRLVVDQKDGPDAAVAAMRLGLAALGDLGIAEGSVVSGYWPIATEIDPRPLLAKLDARGVTTALPVVVGAGEPLVFRRWRPVDPLDEGVFGTRHPLPDAEEVMPDALLVPLLAVDRRGYRLGHGRGYFDITLARLRARRPVTAIGIGYAIQLVDQVPHDDHDEPVDWILTDRALARAER